MLQIEPDRRRAMAVAATERVVFGASLGLGRKSESIIQSTCRQSLEELRQLMLGFDVDPKHTARLLAEWSQNCPADSDEIRQSEDEILNIFVDICSLFQRQPEVNHRASGEEPSAEAYLFSYLRMLETRGEGLPPAFVERAPARAGSLRRADAGSLARTGREPALDLQIAPTRGAANRAGSGRPRTASAARRRPWRRTPRNPSGRFSTG